MMVKSIIHKTPYYFIMPYARLLGFTTQSLAQQLEMTPQTLRNKINRKCEFTISEGERLIEVLRVPLADLLKTEV